MNDGKEVFDDEFIQNVCDALDGFRPVQKKLPGWGELHIDRRLPFICIYRRPASASDKGIGELLLSQASFITVTQRDSGSAGFHRLLALISGKMSLQFGAFLFFEICVAHQGDEEQPLRLDLSTSNINPPQKMLEETENALLEMSVSYPDITLELSYSDHPGPEGEASLTSCTQLNGDNYYWLVLKVSPVYRRNNTILPYVLRQLKASMTIALRRILYAFVHRYTTHTPSHYHELGRQSITDEVLKMDRQMAQIREQFDILFHVTPVNSDEAWQQFCHNRYQKPPTFKYRPRPIDPDLLKRKLYSIKIESLDDPALAHLFHSQREEISRLLSMIADRNTVNFQYGSLQVYGGVDSELKSAAEQIFQQSGKQHETDVLPPIDAKQLGHLADAMFKQYKMQCGECNFSVEIRDDLPGILVSKGTLMIGHTARFSQSRVEAILAHEVGTHLVTYFNGLIQPFQQFHSGMSDYEPLQEGIAVFSEYLVGGLNLNRLRTLAARVYGVEAMLQGAGFVDVFRLISVDLGFSAEHAFQITMRIFRGGGFTKDVVYLRGLLELVSLLKTDEDLQMLFVGKIAAKHLSFVKELKWRKMLKDLRVLPHYLSRPESASKIDAIRNSKNVFATLLGQGT